MSSYGRLDSFSTEELEAEIELRKKPSVPQPLDLQEIEWRYVLDYAMSLISDLEAGLDLPEDFEQGLFSTVMDVVYGSDSWRDWWNKNLVEAIAKLGR
jgi:hypothetical protein